MQADTSLLNSLLKSVIDQDRAPVVICDMDSVIRYMNPASVAYYRRDLTGKPLKGCHNPESGKKIDRVLAWFGENPAHNQVHTAWDEKDGKDIYMVALRDDAGSLIGYYEKHEYRTRDTASFYTF